MEKPPTYPWPVWKWPESGWVWTVLGSIIAILVLAFPDLTKLTGRQRFEIAATAVLATSGYVLLRYVGRVATTAVCRALAFDRLSYLHDATAAELRRTKRLASDLIRERESLREFRILYTFVHEEAPYIALARKPGIKLVIGQRLVVADPDGSFRGAFDVVEERAREYLARCAAGMDPVWLGYARLAGAAHSEAPVGATAILLATNGEKDDFGSAN